MNQSMTNSVPCPVCDGSGELTEKYNKEILEPVHDALSGYVGYELRNKQTGEVILASDAKEHMVACFNCEGTGILEWDDE